MWLHLGYKCLKRYQLLGFLMHTQSTSCRTRMLTCQVEIAINQLSCVLNWPEACKHGMIYHEFLPWFTSKKVTWVARWEGLPSIARWVQARPAMTLASEHADGPDSSPASWSWMSKHGRAWYNADLIIQNSSNSIDSLLKLDEKQLDMSNGAILWSGAFQVCEGHDQIPPGVQTKIVCAHWCSSPQHGISRVVLHPHITAHH